MAINYHNMDQELNKADYIVRIIAHLIDTVILGTFTLLVNLLMVVTSYLTSGEIFWGSVGFHISLMLLIVFICCVLYSVISVATCGATVGKYMMKIEVVTTEGRELTIKQIVCREFIGRTLCKVMLYSGFIMMFYNADGLGLHDKLSGTMVVKKGKDLMELAVGKEILRKALLEGEEEERYNRIYNRGINARLSGGAIPAVEKKVERPEQTNIPQNTYGTQGYGDNPYGIQGNGVMLQDMHGVQGNGVMPQDMYGLQGNGVMSQDMYGMQGNGAMPQDMYGSPNGSLQGQEMYVPPEYNMMNQGGSVPCGNLMMGQEIQGAHDYEMVAYQEALQNVVDEHSLMEECQQHVEFYT